MTFRPRFLARSRHTFTVPSEADHDSGDVKYRVGRLKSPLEGNDAKNGVLFKVGDLGIPDKTESKDEVVVQPCAVPQARPDAQATARKHDPERYTHGGLSMAECMIPHDRAGPKVNSSQPFDLAGIRFEGVLSEGQPLDILITARAKARSRRKC